MFKALDLGEAGRLQDSGLLSFQLETHRQGGFSHCGAPRGYSVGSPVACVQDREEEHTRERGRGRGSCLCTAEPQGLPRAPYPHRVRSSFAAGSSLGCRQEGGWPGICSVVAAGVGPSKTVLSQGTPRPQRGVGSTQVVTSTLWAEEGKIQTENPYGTGAAAAPRTASF